MLLSFLLATARAVPQGRAVQFTDEVGYIRVDKGLNCWDQCGQRKNWAGHCGFCGVSNGSPGFCCHPDGRGHCSRAMVEALKGSSGYQCVIPKYIDDDSLVQTRTLNVEKCWEKCGRKKNWAGKCGRCGANGYCCNADGRGSCPGSFAATLRAQGHVKNNMCVVPLEITATMKDEFAPGSACKSLSRTECKTLSSLQAAMPAGRIRAMSAEFKECQRFFSTTQCALPSTPAANEKPVCLTRITNRCETEPAGDFTVHRETIVTIPLADLMNPSWNAYQKEFFRFIDQQASVSMEAVAQFMGDLDSSSADAMSKSLVTALQDANLFSNAHAIDIVDGSHAFGVFRFVFAILDTMASEWSSNDAAAFDSIDMQVNYNSFADLYSVRSIDFDTMVAHSGASFGTQSNVINQYENIFQSVASWTKDKEFIYSTLEAAKVKPWLFNDLMVAIAALPTHLSYGAAIEGMLTNAEGLMTAEHVADVAAAFHSDAGRNLATNAATAMGVMSALKRAGVEPNPAVMMAAMEKAMGDDPLNMDATQWDGQLAAKLTYHASRLHGAAANAGFIANEVRDTFGNLRDLATVQARYDLTKGAKPVYKSLVSEFFTQVYVNDVAAPSFEVQDVVMGAVNTMPELSSGTPSKQLASYMRGFALMHNSTQLAEDVYTLSKDDGWARLEVPLMALTLLDADARITDDEINNAFGCGSACDFSGIDWELGPPPVDASCVPDDVKPGATEKPGTTEKPKETTEMKTTTDMKTTTGFETATAGTDPKVETTTTATTSTTTTFSAGRMLREMPVRATSQDGYNGIMEATMITCAACATPDEAINDAKGKWCDAQRVMNCKVDAWCTDKGCFCPDSEVSEWDGTGVNMFGEKPDMKPGMSGKSFRTNSSEVALPELSLVYAKVVMEYLMSNGTHGVALTPSQLQCAAEALVTLPPLAVNETREMVQQHVFAELFLKGAQGEDFDNIQAALTNNIFNLNGAFILENMLATQLALNASGLDTDISGWDLSVIDWSIDGRERTDLSTDYQTQILSGLAGNPVQGDIEGIYEEIYRDSSGYTTCAKTELQGTIVWNCPNAIAAQNPSIENGCTREPNIEEVCVLVGTEEWQWAAGLTGAWSMQWFQDQLAMYNNPPGLSGEFQAGMMAAWAQGAAAMGNLGWYDGGDVFKAEMNSWFEANGSGNQSAVAAAILADQEQWEGLDWLITAGGMWGGEFAANNGGSNWGMYDMMDEIRNDGQWNMFGKDGNGNYNNISAAWMGDWIYGQDSGWQNEEYLKEYMNGTNTYAAFFNATNNIALPGGGGGGGGGGDNGDGVNWSEIVNYPVNDDCLKQVVTEDVLEFFNFNSKSQEVLDGVSAAMTELTVMLPCGGAMEGLENYLKTYFNDVIGDPILIWDCFDSPTKAALSTRLEAILGVAKIWDQETPNTDQDFKEIDWDWITYDLTAEDITDEFLQTNLEGMDEIDDILSTLINDNKLIDTIQEENGNRVATTTAASTTPAPTGDTAADTTTAAAGTTTTQDIDAGANTTPVTTGANGATTSTANPYAPGMTVAPGNGGMAGDPHVWVKVPGQEAICFEVSDVQHSVIDLLSDPATGLEVNGELIQEGKNIRLGKIYVVTPRNVEIAIYPAEITMGHDGNVENRYTFETDYENGVDDVHFEIQSHIYHRKNGMILTLVGVNGKPIKLHFSIKNGKNSMKFEVLDSTGLAGANLQGIVGHSILPAEYSIDADGVIHVQGRLIKNAKVEWNEHELCHHIQSEHVPDFLGHRIRAFEVESKFERLKVIDAQLIDASAPK